MQDLSVFSVHLRPTRPVSVLWRRRVSGYCLLPSVIGTYLASAPSVMTPLLLLGLQEGGIQVQQPL
jgi:hypothetical protein